MSVVLVCDHCSKSLKAPESTLGKQVRCPACKGVFLAKATLPVTPPASPAPDLTEENPKQTHGHTPTNAPTAPSQDDSDIPSTQDAVVDGNQPDFAPAPKKAKAKKKTSDEMDNAGEDTKPAKIKKKTVKPSSQLILRVLILLCGVLGGASATALGYFWQQEQEKYKDVAALLSVAGSVGGGSDKVSQASALFQAHGDAYPFLFVAGGLGLIGGILGFARFPWFAAPILLVAAAPAAIYCYQSLLFSAALPFGCLLCVFLRTTPQARREAERLTSGEFRPSPLIGILGQVGAVVCLLILLGYHTFIGFAISKIDEDMKARGDIASSMPKPTVNGSPSNIFGSRVPVDKQEPAQEIPVGQIQQELDASGAGVKMTKLDLTPAGLDFTMDAPEGTQFKKGFSDVEITKDAHFAIKIELGKKNFADKKKNLREETIIVNTPDTVLFTSRWGGGYTFFMTVTAGYQDVSISNNTWLNGKSAEQSKADCLLMMKCVRTLAPKTALPNDPAVAIERFKAEPSRQRNQEAPRPDELVVSDKTTDATLALLKGLPNIRALNLGNTSLITDDGLAHLKAVPNLEELSFSSDGWSHGSPFTAKGIKVLAELPKLKELNLGSCEIGADALPHLKELTRLDALYLSSSSIDDSICSHLKGLNNLKLLSLSRTKILGPGLAQFNDSPNLKVLYLNNIPINDSGIQNIGGLTRLEELYLNNDDIKGEGFAALKKLTHLKVLNLANTKFTDVGMEHLSGMVELEDLDLNSTKITDQGLAYLKDMKNLKTLDLTSTAITEDAIKYLDKLEKLEEIKSYNNKISNAARAKRVKPPVAIDKLKPADPVGLIKRFNGKFETKPGDEKSIISVNFDQAQLKNLDLAELRDLKSLRVLRLGFGGEVSDAGLVYLKDLTELEELDLSNVSIKEGLLFLNGMTKLKKLRLPFNDLSAHQMEPISKLVNLEEINCNLNDELDRKLAVLAHLTKLQTIQLHNSQLSDESLEQLGKMVGLQTLYLPATVNWRVNDAALVHLKNLTNLKSLDIPGSAVTGAGFEHLSGLTQLELLNLQHSPFGDAGMKYLSKFSKLRGLNLMQSNVTDAGLAHLAGLTELSNLNLDHTRVTGTGFEPLKNLNKLFSLNANNTPFSDLGMKNLQAVSGLRFLGLSGTEVTDAGLEHLKSMKNLSDLVLSKTQITGSGFAQAGDLSNLSQLVLDDSKFADIGLVHLAKMTGLNSLQLQNTPVTGAGFDKLKELKELTEISLKGAQLNDEGLKQLSQITPLSFLTISETRITDAGLPHLSHLVNLRQLALDGASITGKGFKDVKELKKLTSLALNKTKIENTNLQYLKNFATLNDLQLEGTFISDEGLVHLKEMAMLHSLNLANTPITNNGLEHLSGVKTLQYLNAMQTALTNAGVEKLKEKLPNCNVSIN